MCGAAAESILLAAAIEQAGDAEKILKAYSGPGGRGRVLRGFLAQVSDNRLRGEFSNLFHLLGDWRDKSAHGQAARLTAAHAFHALATVLRLAQLTLDNWNPLTQRVGGSE